MKGRSKMKTTKLFGTIATLLTMAVVLSALLPAAGSASAPVPTIAGVSGSVWNYKCPSSFNGYLEVPYSGRSDSGARQIAITGTNLNLVTSSAVSAPGYTTTIVSKSANRIVLDVRAGAPGENPRPAANPTLTLSSPVGTIKKQITGLIPTFYADNLDWGQC